MASKQKSPRKGRSRKSVSLAEPHNVGQGQSPGAIPAKIVTRTSQKRKNKDLRGSESRRIRTRGSPLYTGLHPVSRLGSKMLAGEGTIEQDFWMIVDFAFDGIVDAFSQPFPVEIEVRGEKSTWTPDGLLVYGEGRRGVLVECKPIKVLQPDKSKYPLEAQLARERYFAWLKAANDRDLDLLVMSEDDVRLEPRYHNAEIWLRASGFEMPVDDLEVVCSWLPDWPRTFDVEDLAFYLEQYANSALLVACLLDRLGYVKLDRTAYFSGRTTMVNLMSRQSSEKTADHG
jgi:hypothetical protein